MPFDPREAQTRIKHGILGEYVGAWAGIITNGLRRRVRRGHAHADFVYLDGFSGPGLYESDLANPPGAGPVEGSPLIGIRSLLAAASIMTEVGLVPRFTAVLVEKRREWADELLGVVEQAGFSLEVAPVSTVAEIQLGRINVLQADFRDAIGPVLGSLPPHAWLLALIDPFGPSMRMSALAPLLRRRNTDAIIFFPSHWVQVRGGSRNKFLENWTDTDWENIRRLDQLFGSERWQEIAMKAGTSAAERIDRYAHLYKSQLDALGRKIFIKSIGLRFSASPIETAGYHLFLVTGNADGAMRMTDILRRAEFSKHWEHWTDHCERVRRKQESLGVLELDLNMAPVQEPEVELAEPAPEEVDEALERVLHDGESVSWGDLKGRLAGEIFTEGEISKGLRRLRKRSAVYYENRLTNRTEIRVGKLDSGQSS